MNDRHDKRRGAGGPRKGERVDLVEDPTNIDTAPPARALVPSPKRGSLFVADSALPSVAARLPVGMATAEQIDSFRELRTRLLQMARGVGLGYFTTLVAPMTPDSGASFVARNLAAAFTLQDHQIATLVDCNLRHPTQHTALGARADEGGLFDFLEQPHAAIDRIVCATGISGLHLIPAGHSPQMAREYFSSPAMRMLMTALRQEACFVVLDGPPAVGSPDARILSALADFVILVVGYGRTSPEKIAEAAGLFEASKFAGVVFNERT